MKKVCTIVAVLMMLFYGNIGNAVAADWLWDDPYPQTTKVNEIAANPITGDVYGIDENGNIVVLNTSTTFTGVDASPGAVAPPAQDLAVGRFGTVYALGSSLVTTWDATNGYNAIVPQPKIPDGITGTYKHITTGRFGKVFVLFEATEGGAQYLLAGHSPAITDGVIIRFNPNVLNLASKGNWVSCSISLPTGYSVKDIDPDSIRITKIQIQVSGGDPIDVVVDIPIAANTPVSTSQNKLNVKFTRFDKNLPGNLLSLTGLLSDLLDGGAKKTTIQVLVTVEAQLKTTGEVFTGTASIQVQIPALKLK